MTKKVLLKWVEQKQQEALALVDAQYRTSLNEHTAALYARLGIADVAVEIFTLLSKADNILLNWQERSRSEVGISDYWNSLHNLLYRYTKSPEALFNALCTEEFSDTTEERTILNLRLKEMTNAVNTNYQTVRNNLRALETAKLGLEYLKELGFDVSELLSAEQKPISTALAVPVNTHFLFLNKGGTQNEN